MHPRLSFAVAMCVGTPTRHMTIRQRLVLRSMKTTGSGDPRSDILSASMRAAVIGAEMPGPHGNLIFSFSGGRPPRGASFHNEVSPVGSFATGSKVSSLRPAPALLSLDLSVL